MGPCSNASGSVKLEFSNSASKDAAFYTILRKDAGGDWKTVSSLKHLENSNGFSYRDSTIKHGIAYEYAAKAIDEDSLQSVMCTPVRAQLRGTENLAAIPFTKASYDASQNAVVLQWKYEAPGSYYFVIWRSLSGSPLERYRTLEKGTKEWKDLHIDQAGQGYQYAVQAVYENNAKATRVEGVEVRK